MQESPISEWQSERMMVEQTYTRKSPIRRTYTGRANLCRQIPFSEPIMLMPENPLLANGGTYTGRANLCRKSPIRANVYW